MTLFALCSSPWDWSSKHWNRLQTLSHCNAWALYLQPKLPKKCSMYAGTATQKHTEKLFQLLKTKWADKNPTVQQAKSAHLQLLGPYLMEADFSFSPDLLLPSWLPGILCLDCFTVSASAAALSCHALPSMSFWASMPSYAPLFPTKNCSDWSASVLGEALPLTGLLAASPFFDELKSRPLSFGCCSLLRFCRRCQNKFHLQLLVWPTLGWRGICTNTLSWTKPFINVPMSMQTIKTSQACLSGQNIITKSKHKIGIHSCLSCGTGAKVDLPTIRQNGRWKGLCLIHRLRRFCCVPVAQGYLLKQWRFLQISWRH